MPRALSLLLATWLSLLIAEPAALHTCAMHSTGHGTHTAQSALTTPASASEHSEHAAHHTQTTDQPAPEHCQCLGECCATAATDVPRATESLVPAPAAITQRVVALPDIAPRTGAPDLRLPFAQGPPRTLTA